MKKISLFSAILTISLMTLIVLLPQKILSQQHNGKPESGLKIQPLPRIIKNLNQSVLLNQQGKGLFVRYNVDQVGKAAAYLKMILGKKFDDSQPVTIQKHAIGSKNEFSILLKLDGDLPNARNDQYYSIRYSKENNEVEISSAGRLGLLYGVITFSECIQQSREGALLHLYEIEDWPAYRRRIFVASPQSDDVDKLLDFALRNKMETIALASRVYPWYEVDKNYEAVLSRIKKWKDKYGGPHIMQMHNIYAGKKIEISNPADVAGLKKVIEAGIRSGADRLMILADDLAPFKFGEGYVLTSGADKAKFKSMAEAHCYLLNNIWHWLQKKSCSCELYYVPPFYTYEDMYYGDMALYRDTPWESDAFGPLKRDLKYIGLNLPEDVFVIWSGPNVRSRMITAADLKDWSANLQGRAPFLWDNTIYSHHPFTTTALFSAYSNSLPSDFERMTAGNGMFINGDANSEEMKAAMVTANDFLWNPAGYDAEKSLHTAMERRYGRESLDLLLNFKDVELTLRRKIGERALWFEADTLWDVIRKAKALTGKNPFYYHLNYGRLKALRLQLKYSVPEVQPKQVFIKECRELSAKRTAILNELKMTNAMMSGYLRSIAVALPDSGKIQ